MLIGNVWEHILFPHTHIHTTKINKKYWKICINKENILNCLRINENHMKTYFQATADENTYKIH